MYIAAFALLSVVGAWGAWRSNPAYSTKRTFRYVLVTLLAIAAAIAAIVTTIDLTERGSQSVQFGAMAGVIVACTLGLIWLIMTATFSQTATRPSAKLVTVHRRKLLPWVRRFAGFVAGAALLAIVLPEEGRLVVCALGGLAIFLGIVLLFAGYLAALHFDRSLTSVESDP
jgi:hypothetical protein